MIKKLITKSFERLLDKGLQRGFITYEELGKSLGKRNSTQENVEKAIFIIFEKKVSLLKKKVIFKNQKRKMHQQNNLTKHLKRVMIQLECTYAKWEESSYSPEKAKLR